MLRGQEQQLWHTDSSFKTTPALASVLSARIIPENGGETEFASTRLAWDRLPDPQKEELRDLIVVHSYANSRDQIDPKLMTPQERAALPPVPRLRSGHSVAECRAAVPQNKARVRKRPKAEFLSPCEGSRKLGGNSETGHQRK